MLVVDASCLFEVVADTARSQEISAWLAADTDQAAPEVIDVEVLGVIRAQYLRGRLDGTAAGQAVADLRDWPGERYGHRLLLDRVWQRSGDQGCPARRLVLPGEAGERPPRADLDQDRR